MVTHLFVESVTSASGEHAAKVSASKTATLRMKPPVLLAGSRASAQPLRKTKIWPATPRCQKRGGANSMIISWAELSCEAERHARVCSKDLDVLGPPLRRADRSGPRAIYFLDVASFSRSLSAFLSAVILASSVAVSCSWSINSSSRDIESSSLCFMTISNFGMRYHK